MIDFPFNSIEFAEVWSDFLENKKDNHKFEYSQRGMKIALKKLYRYSKGSEKIAIAILENSISENWKGFHPLPYNDPLIKELNQKDKQAKKISLADKMKLDYGIN